MLKKTHLINYFKSYEYKFFPLKFFHSFHREISAFGSRSVFFYNAVGVLPQYSHTANRFAYSLIDIRSSSRSERFRRGKARGGNYEELEEKIWKKTPRNLQIRRI